jgi:osmotically-inducible protein OsmY
MFAMMDSPTTHDHDDPVVLARLQSLIEARMNRRIRTLAIAVDRGIAKLSGTVRSYYERQLAHHCAKHTPGVIEVLDTIVVSPNGKA